MATSHGSLLSAELIEKSSRADAPEETQPGPSLFGQRRITAVYGYFALVDHDILFLVTLWMLINRDIRYSRIFHSF